MSDVENIPAADRRLETARAYKTAKSNIAAAPPSQGNDQCTDGDLPQDAGDEQKKAQTPTEDAVVKKTPSDSNGFFCDMIV